MDQIEEVLRDEIHLIERAIVAVEKGNQHAGLDLVDEDGKLIEHMSFYQDVTPYQKRLEAQKQRLDTYLAGLV